MKKYISWFLCMLVGGISNQGFAQSNLLSNGSFEGFAQTDPTTKALQKKVALGLYSHGSGRLVTAYFELQLARRLTIEPSVGFTIKGSDQYVFGVTPTQQTLHYKFAGAMDLKYFFLFHRRNALEGLFAALTGSYYRSSADATASAFTFYRDHVAKAGIGLGGNYYFLPRFSVGATAYINWSNGRAYYLKEDGGVRLAQQPDGFLLTWAAQVGFSF